MAPQRVPIKKRQTPTPGVVVLQREDHALVDVGFVHGWSEGDGVALTKTGDPMGVLTPGAVVQTVGDDRMTIRLPTKTSIVSFVGFWAVPLDEHGRRVLAWPDRIE